MSIATQAHQELLEQNAELRARLEEAEELLAAIRSGDVDAVVVESEPGPRVFVLQGVEAESNRFRGEIIAQVSDTVVATDSEGRITYLNPAAERQYGVSASDVLGRRAEEMFEVRWLQEGASEALDVALRERREWRGEIQHVLRDGRELSVESSITPLVDRAGRAIGQLAVIRDITDRKRTEEALRHSEERYRALVEVSPQVVWMADPAGACTFVNQHWFDYTGQTMTEATGLGWIRAIDPEHRERVERQWGCTVAEGTSWSVEYPLWRAADRTYRWHLSRAMPLRDTAGSVVQWIGAAVDIHDLKQAERALRDADRLKDEFLATLAHELRNPLAPVRNAVQILRRQSPVPGSQWAGDIIDRQVGNLSRLIDDLMDVSRINLGRIELKREQLDLATVLRIAVETSRPFIEECGHRLAVTLPPVPVMIDADMTRLAQVFWNLLNNAAKYMSRGGLVELTAHCEGDYVLVSVRDRGIGIAAANLSSLFEMFSQVETALSRSQGGLGIGLYVVKRLVDMHGGRVSARSDGPGSGSEFVVRLPIVREQKRQAAADDRPGAADSPSNLRVLVVDDNTDGADTAALLLQILGNQVETAHDGDEAVRAASRFRPDVILLDIGLPKMDGYQVARAIRQQPWGRDIVLIATTGWGADEDLRRSAAAGFDHHLVKPVDPQALMAILAHLTSVRTDIASA